MNQHFVDLSKTTRAGVEEISAEIAESPDNLKNTLTGYLDKAQATGKSLQSADACQLAQLTSMLANAALMAQLPFGLQNSLRSRADALKSTLTGKLLGRLLGYKRDLASLEGFVAAAGAKAIMAKLAQALCEKGAADSLGAFAQLAETGIELGLQDRLDLDFPSYRSNVQVQGFETTTFGQSRTGGTFSSSSGGLGSGLSGLSQSSRSPFSSGTSRTAKSAAFQPSGSRQRLGRSDLPYDVVYASDQRFTETLLAKLNGIDEDATDDQTPTEIRQALESLRGNDRLDAENIKNIPSGGPGGGLSVSQVDARIADPAKYGNTSLWPRAKLPADAVYTETQRFTTALLAKLNGIENNAKDDQSPTEIRDALAGLTGNARLAATAIRGLPQGTSGLDQAAVDARIVSLRPNEFTNADETKLDGIAAGAEVNVQSDWNATSGDAQILNKPTIPTPRTNAEIDARIATTARAGNTERWDKSKLPADTIYTNTQRFTTTLLAKLNALPAAADLEFDNHAIGTANALNALSRTTSSLDFVTVTAAVSSGITANTVVDGSGTALTSLAAGDLLILDHAQNKWVRIVNLPTATVVSQATVRNFLDGDFVEGLLAGLSGANRLSYTSLKDTPTIPAAQVPSDWNAATGVRQILNKPTVLTQTQVDARIATEARAGNNARWPTSKVPTIATLGGATPANVVTIADARALARYTAQEKTKLAGVETAATADQTAAEIKSSLETLSGSARLSATAIKDLPTQGTSGLTEGQVDARVVAGTLAQARTGNTTRWEKSKLPSDTAYGNIPGNTEIDARIAVEARTGNTSRWGTDKVPTLTALGGQTQTQVDARISALRPNVFTDAEKTKLGGMEANAKDDQTASEIRDALQTLTGNSRLGYGHIKDAPATASRWPTYAEVTGTKPPSNAEQNVKANWNETDTASDAFVENKPNLHSVATSGSYNDLGNKPSIPDNSAIDARVVSGTLAQARAGNTDRWPVGKVPTLAVLGGQTQAQVDARIATEARAGNTGRWPTSKVPTLATLGGQTQAQVDARVAALRPNEFTNADETKLDGIEAAATADQTPQEIRDALQGLSGTARLGYGDLKDTPTIPDLASRAEAEAGTETAARLFSPELIKQAIDELAPSGGGGGGGSVAPADFSISSVGPTSAVSLTTPSIAGTVSSPQWTAWTSVGTFPLPASQAGPVLLAAKVRAERTTPVPTGGGDRIFTQARIVRTRGSTDTILVVQDIYGPRNVNTPSVQTASKAVSSFMLGHDTAQENDTYKVEVRVSSQSTSRTIQFDIANNGLSVFSVSGGGLGQDQVDGRISPRARIGDTGRWDKSKVPSDTIYEASQRFTPALSAKLAGIENNATADQTPTEIRDAIQGLSGANRLSYNNLKDQPTIPTPRTNAEIDGRIISTARTGNTDRWPKSKLPNDTVYTDTQRFSSADETKLAGIEDNATADQSATEIRDALAGLSGSARLAYGNLKDTPAIPAQVPSDWNATTGAARILNKPTIPAAQVSSDWNATSGIAQILNKPTIPVPRTDAEIDARIETTARAGNTGRWAKAKLPIDTAYGTIPAVASQAEAQAGTETAARLFSPARVKETVQAFGGWTELGTGTAGRPGVLFNRTGHFTRPAGFVSFLLTSNLLPTSIFRDATGTPRFNSIDVNISQTTPSAQLVFADDANPQQSVPYNHGPDLVKATGKYTLVLKVGDTIYALPLTSTDMNEPYDLDEPTGFFDAMRTLRSGTENPSVNIALIDEDLWGPEGTDWGNIFSSSDNEYLTFSVARTARARTAYGELAVAVDFGSSRAVSRFHPALGADGETMRSYMNVAGSVLPADAYDHSGALVFRSQGGNFSTYSAKLYGKKLGLVQGG